LPCHCRMVRICHPCPGRARVSPSAESLPAGVQGQPKPARTIISPILVRSAGSFFRTGLHSATR
jgi:hypothetical protein